MFPSRVGYAAAVETKLHSRQRVMTDGGPGMKPPPARLDVSREELQNLLEHARSALSEQEYQQLKAALDTLVYLTQLVEDKNTTIGRLRQILFGSSSEKMSQVLETLEASGGSAEPRASDGPAEERNPLASPEPAPRPGHGRNGAETYQGARQVKIEHASLKSGNRCPGCQKGKLYVLGTPGVLMRVVGQAPLAATVYELEKLRCNLCGEVFTAEPPAGVDGRRRFVEVAAKFPEECRYVLESLGEVYKHDAFCQEHGMSPEERLGYHQTYSGPRMKELEQWFREQFVERKVEPNSGLGQATCMSSGSAKSALVNPIQPTRIWACRPSAMSAPCGCSPCSARSVPRQYIPTISAITGNMA